MKRKQIEMLQSSGEALLENARLLTNNKQMQQTMELGFKALAEARKIMDSLTHNSAMLFIECCGYLNKSPDSYQAYVEFCARNNLDIFSKIDFEALVTDLVEY